MFQEDQEVAVVIQVLDKQTQEPIQQRKVVQYQVKETQVVQDFTVQVLQEEKVVEVVAVTVPLVVMVVKLQLLLLFQILVMVVRVQILVQVFQVYQTQEF